jgi:hypothetical protein
VHLGTTSLISRKSHRIGLICLFYVQLIGSISSVHMQRCLLRRFNKLIAIPFLLCARSAHALVLMESEIVPMPDFSERVLTRGPAAFSARLVAGVGQDAVETPINEQSEKRIFAALGLGVQAGIPFSEKVRIDVSSTAMRSSAGTQVQENSGWRKSESHSEVNARGQVRFKLSDGVFAGAGATWLMRPAALETFEFAGQSAIKKYSGYSFWTPEYSLSKDSGGWSAGLGWRPSARQRRELTREGSDESTAISEDVVLDELWSAGVVAQISGGRSLRLDVNLNGANATQLRDSDTSGAASTSASTDDETRRRYEVSFVFGFAESGSHKLSVGGAYQSIGYSDQSNVMPQTIPLWSLLVRDEFKHSDLNLFVDLLFGYGTDMQSLPDLNANYKRMILSAQTGVNF